MVQKVRELLRGANVGNLKQLTVPSQTLTYVPKIKVASSGVTDFRLTIPKRYKNSNSHTWFILHWLNDRLSFGDNAVKAY